MTVIESLTKLIMDIDSRIVPTKIRMNASLRNDLGFDSLEEVELYMKAERKFGITIDDASAAQFETVGDIVRYIETHSRNIQHALAQNVVPGPLPKQQTMLNLIAGQGATIKFTQLPYRRTYDINVGNHRIIIDDLPAYKFQSVIWNGVEQYKAVKGRPVDNFNAIRELMAACGRKVR